MRNGPERFPQRLRELRTRRRVSTRTLSELCGLSPSVVSRYERGDREPTIGTLVELADYFGVTADYLLGRD